MGRRPTVRAASSERLILARKCGADSVEAALADADSVLGRYFSHE
jgi:hypothetical protein